MTMNEPPPTIVMFFLFSSRCSARPETCLTKVKAASRREFFACCILLPKIKNIELFSICSMASTMASATSLPSKKRKASTTSNSSIDGGGSITSDSNNSDSNNNNDNANKNNIQNGQQPASSLSAAVSDSRIPEKQSEKTSFANAAIPLNEEASSSSAAAIPEKKSEETSSSKAAISIPLNEEGSSASAAASLNEHPGKKAEEAASSKAAISIPLNEETSSSSAAVSLSEIRLPSKKSEETASSKAAISIPLNEEASSLSAAASLNEHPGKKTGEAASSKAAVSIPLNEEASSLSAAASLNEHPGKKAEEAASSKAAISIPLNEEASSLSAAASLNESRLPRKKSEETASSKVAIPLNESRLPSKKRKGSLDTNHTFNFEEDARKRKYSHDSSATFEGDFWRRKLSYDSNFEDFQTQRRKLSDNSNSTLRIDDLMAPEPLPALPALLGPMANENSASSAQLLELQPIETTEYREHLDSQDMSALEHLDALGIDSVVLPLHAPAEPPIDPTNAAAVAQRNPDADDTSSNGTFASSGQRLLLEAIMMATSGSQGGGGSGSYGIESLPKEQLFESLPKEQPFVKDQLYPRSNAGRDRLESWGGMSDLSLPHIGSTEIAMASAALQQQQQQHQPQLEQQRLQHVHPTQQEVGDPNLEETSKPSAIPSRISLERDRLNSIASLSEFSLSGMPSMALEGIDMSGDIQAFVAMAMASVGDQLAELAGAVESVAFTPNHEVLDNLKGDKTGTESENSSVASPLIGAMSDTARGGRHEGRSRNRPRSWSASSGKISVDYEAVAAAVDAANAATGTLDLAAIGSMAPPPPPSGSLSIGSRDQKRKRRQLPLNRHRGSSASSDDREQSSSQNQMHPPVQSSISDCEMDRIRERARAAAGYKPPSKKNPPSQKSSLPPIKKRAKRNSPEPDRTNSAYVHIGTPKVSNRTTKAAPKSIPYTPLVPTSEVSGKSSKGQATQKWESMFDCLIGFIEDRRKEEPGTMTEEEKKAWIWDGNVPTTYKTKDGKALGRWVNNQRSAKSKGSLKDEREHRLVDAGLKWSVLASNSWNEMLEELRIYVQETVKQGIKWDGNVPTNYQIKTRPNGRFAGEDKNLGRWVNRQRSLFQARKLRKDRQLSLEKLGLKWSMLATTSWDSMYETLCDYVDEKKQGSGDWDGNVPANFRTSENPPRALGRWINRQRSAFMKNKLKKEYMEKLNTVGLKWSVHERSERSKSEGRGDAFDEDDDEMDDDDFVVADGELNGIKEETPDTHLSISRENTVASTESKTIDTPVPDKAVSLDTKQTI
jgi:hypothetical protein